MPRRSDTKIYRETELTKVYKIMNGNILITQIL